MTTFDIIVLIISFASFFFGMKQGLIKEVVGLVGIIVAIWIATKFSYITYDFLAPYIEDPSICPIIAFVATVIIALIVIDIAANAISRIVSATFILSSINRIGGAVFSVIKSLFLIGCVLWIFETYVDASLLVSPSQQESSYTYKPIKMFTSTIIDRVDIPESKKAITDFLDQISNKQ
ncbi:MAG: CvpA family protein [Bacteroidia bacterium]|nr:CvpA family protein [Bacteroidia bacterium]